MANHRYWRLTITLSTAGSSNLISLYEVEMRNSDGGSDLCSGGTASASHNNSTVHRLFDNDPGTYWSNGAPSATCWFQYDFSAGDVEINQLWIRPSDGGKSPVNFTLSSSDDGTGWSEEAAWSGITDWSSGVGKVIDLPRPGVVGQNAHPFVLTLTRPHPQPYVIGVFLSSSLSAPHALRLAREADHPYTGFLEGQHRHFYGFELQGRAAHPYTLHLTVSAAQPWSRWMLKGLRQPLFDRIQQVQTVPWSLRIPIQSLRRLFFTQTGTVRHQHRQGYLLHPRTPLDRGHRRSWDLLEVHGWIQQNPPVVLLDGQSVGVIDLTILAGQDQPGWQVHLLLADENGWQRWRLNDPLIVAVDQVAFHLVVSEKAVWRNGEGGRVWSLKAVSLLAHEGTPLTTPLAADWQAQGSARQIVETLLAGPIQWQLVDWCIEAGRLTAQGRTPVACVGRIVGAVGGVVQTLPDGSVIAQPRFAMPPSLWSVNGVDHTLTDAADNVEIRETSQAQRLYDRITVRDGAEDRTGGFLAVGLDPRPEGPNQGRTRFAPGEASHLLVTRSPGLAPSFLVSSADPVIPTGRVDYPIVEFLAFYHHNQARLSRPIERIEQTVWLGRDLGTPRLEADGRTVTVSTVGTAVLRVEGMVSGTGYQFQAPPSLGGTDDFPVAFSTTAESPASTVRSVTRQRNSGRYPAPDIVDPLLSDATALQARGEQVLHLGEAWQTVEVTVLFRASVLPGQRVEIHDAHYGRTFRAMITHLSHHITPDQAITRLTLWRPVDVFGGG